MKRRRIGLFLLSVMLLAGCGSREDRTALQKDEVVDSLEERSIAEKQTEDSGKEMQNDIYIQESCEQMPQNERIKKDIYYWYGKTEDSDISEKEILAAKGNLYAGSLTIQSEEELRLFREWYDWDTLWESTIVFSEDLEQWSEEGLKELACLNGSVHIDSTSDRGSIAAKALTYLTGTEELYFGNVSDVTGDMKQFPVNVRFINILSYQPGDYTRLFKLLKNSQVEEIAIYEDYQTRTEGPKCFWLDDVAEIESLETLLLYDSCIRVRDRALLKQSNLKNLQGYADCKTNLSFVKMLPKLQKLQCAITEEMDLSFLTERTDLELRLRFCQEMVEFEEEAYQKEKYIICKQFDEALNWREQDEENEFLAIYQRKTDGKKFVECFSIREMKNIDGEDRMCNAKTFLRVHDGEKVYDLEPDKDGFDSYRTDSFSLADINFDGTNDIILDRGETGNQALHFEFGWIWNPNEENYELSESYLTIENPSTDQKQKVIRSNWRNSAASHGWALYKFENGEFVMKSRLTEDFLMSDEVPAELNAPDDATVIRWMEEIFENGEVVDTKSVFAVHVSGEEKQYPEEYDTFVRKYMTYSE